MSSDLATSDRKQAVDWNGVWIYPPFSLDPDTNSDKDGNWVKKLGEPEYRMATVNRIDGPTYNPTGDLPLRFRVTLHGSDDPRIGRDRWLNWGAMRLMTTSESYPDHHKEWKFDCVVCGPTVG